MATLQKIRNRGPLLLIVIGLALLAFILGDVWRLTQLNMGMASVGSINGKNVDAQEYQAEVEKYAEIVKFSMGMQNLSETEYAAVKDEVWNNMVRKSLIEKQAKAIGLTVTDEELQYVIETGSSPLLASTPFGNEMTGEFDVDYLRSFLSSYAEMDRSTMPADYLTYYDNLYIKEDVYITMKKEETYNLINHIKLEKKENYKDNEQVGTSYIYLDDILVKEIPIYAKKKSINKQETIFDVIRRWFN